MWYPEEFAKVAEKLSNKYDILIFGSNSEQGIANEIENLLIKKGVFESLEYPWFQPIWEEFKVGDTTFKEFTMEDVAFCRTITKKGYDIYVDPKLIIGHEKMLVLK